MTNGVDVHSVWLATLIDLRDTLADSDAGATLPELAFPVLAPELFPVLAAGFVSPDAHEVAKTKNASAKISDNALLAVFIN
jgi:hypothetical protein